MKTIAITTGDPDGIGPEVTAKALRSSLKLDRVVVFRSSESDHLFKNLSSRFRRIIVASMANALDLPKRRGDLIEIVNSAPAPFWVEDAIHGCLKNDFQGLVTGPLSKTLIAASGLSDIGHTEILSRLCRKKRLFQAYLGSEFHVVLATAHLPLKKVSSSLQKKLFTEAILASNSLRKSLRSKKPLGILGLNPHSGEQGLIGREEASYDRWIATLRKQKVPVLGPLIPDAAFVPGSRERYSVLIALYHDQGLIPFKMIHGRSNGAQLTLGIPFVRTSVDHGTAKDITGLGVADPGSMKDAINWCLKLI